MIPNINLETPLALTHACVPHTSKCAYTHAHHMCVKMEKGEKRTRARQDARDDEKK